MTSEPHYWAEEMKEDWVAFLEEWQAPTKMHQSCETQFVRLDSSKELHFRASPPSIGGGFPGSRELSAADGSKDNKPQ